MDSLLAHILEAYRVGSVAMSEQFSFYQKYKPREIIDVEYEDLSDQTGNSQLSSSESNTTQKLLTPSVDADSDNE